MMEKFKLEVNDSKLSLEFENQKTPYIMTVFSILIQYLAIIFVFFYYANDISIKTIVTIIFIATIMNSFAIWYFTWLMFSRKKLELTSSGAIYSRELFGKIKNDTYKWCEIKNFTSINHKDLYFLTIKKSNDKEIQLFNGIDEEKIEDILPVLNKFKNDIINNPDPRVGV